MGNYWELFKSPKYIYIYIFIYIILNNSLLPRPVLRFRPSFMFFVFVPFCISGFMLYIGRGSNCLFFGVYDFFCRNKTGG